MRSFFAYSTVGALSLAALLLSAHPGSAFAQDKPTETTDGGATAPPDKPANPPGDKPAEGAAAEPKPDGGGAKKSFDEGFSPVDDPEEAKKKKEKENATQWFLGVRFRDFIVPSFLFSLFVKGGPGSVNVFSAGPELTMRSGNLEADFSFTIPYADYSMNSFIFRSKKDPDEAYERVSSSLKLLTASVDLLGNIPLDKAKRFSILIGGGVGISGVVGGITRNQVYSKKGSAKTSPDNPKDWADCTQAQKGAQGGPVGPNGDLYCDSSNNHYGKYSEPSWASGGSKPIVFPYLALPHIAFRAQPIKLLQLRVDGGFSITGFFVGAAAGLKLPI